MLPNPDSFGTHWFGSHKDDPAIFPSKRLRGGDVVLNKTFLLFLGQTRGFAFEGLRMVHYDSPEAAMKALATAEGLKV